MLARCRDQTIIMLVASQHPALVKPTPQTFLQRYKSLEYPPRSFDTQNMVKKEEDPEGDHRRLNKRQKMQKPKTEDEAMDLTNIELVSSAPCPMKFTDFF